jgi:hypothetical protein
MSNIIEFEAQIPILINETKTCMLSVPEGGSIGFDGEFVHVKNHRGGWDKVLTERRFILRWLSDGTLKRKLLPKTQNTEEIKKAYTPSKPKVLSTPPALPCGPPGVSGTPPVLPMVH